MSGQNGRNGSGCGVKTAEEIADEILGQMDDFTQTMIRRDWIVECVQAGMDEAKKHLTASAAGPPAI